MASTYVSTVHIGGAAFSWQMPYKFFYKFLKTKEKDEHVLGPIFVCGNLAWRLEWLPHGQVGDMDDPDNYGLFLRLDSLPGDVESVNARFTISSPCGHYHTDEGSVFSRYNEPMSFGRGNFGKISELTEWIDAMEETHRNFSHSDSPSSSSSSSATVSPSRSNSKLLTVFEVSVSINAIHRMSANHRAVVGAAVAAAAATQPQQPPSSSAAPTNPYAAVAAAAAAAGGGGGGNPNASGAAPPIVAHAVQQYGFMPASAMVANGRNDNNNNNRPPNEPERAPPESLDDIDVDGIRQVLRRHRLEKFVNEVIDLGVEVVADLALLNRADLSRIGCNVVQLRKFDALLGEFVNKNDENVEENVVVRVDENV